MLVTGVVHWRGVLLAAALITLVGAIDDRFDLNPALKLAGQVLAAIVAEQAGVVVREITLPVFGVLHFPNAGPTLTIIGLVTMALAPGLPVAIVVLVVTGLGVGFPYAAVFNGAAASVIA